MSKASSPADATQQGNPSQASVAQGTASPQFWKTIESGKHIDARRLDWAKNVNYKDYVCWWTTSPSGAPVGGLVVGTCRSDYPRFPTRKAAAEWLADAQKIHNKAKALKEPAALAQDSRAPGAGQDT